MTTSVDGAVDRNKGRTLHRELVGMLFALAIGEVAVEGGQLISSGATWQALMPGYAHLFLSGVVITSSWVGWGRSDHSLSDVKSVFSIDFVELMLDVVMVIVYFFLVTGAEKPAGAGQNSIPPSATSESFWIAIVFSLYLLWDLITKWGRKDSLGRALLAQRTWGTISCAALVWWSWRLFAGVSFAGRVVLADVALLCIVLLFRVTKLKNRDDLRGRHWMLIAGLLLAWLIFVQGAVTQEPWGATSALTNTYSR